MTVHKIGVMGCGIVANHGHLPAAAACEGIEVVSVYDPSEKALAKTVERFPEVTPYTDLEAFFRSDIDSVSITSPAGCHYQNLLDAARHGKHVLCEKPLGVNEEESLEMIRVMEEKGLHLWVGLVCRFSPVAIKIRELIRNRTIGDIRSLRLIFNWNCHGKYRPDDDSGVYGLNRRREGRMFEGGPMVDGGVHQVDLARWWLGSEVIRFSGFGAWIEDYEAPDHTWVHMDHENGAHTMIEVSFSYCHTASDPRSEFVYELIGSDGVIRYDRSTKAILVHGKEESFDIPDQTERGFEAMYSEFSKALTTGTSELLASGEDGLIATRITRTATDEAIAKR